MTNFVISNDVSHGTVLLYTMLPYHAKVAKGFTSLEVSFDSCIHVWYLFSFFVHKVFWWKIPCIVSLVVVGCASTKIETLNRTMVRFLSLHLSIEKLIIKRGCLHSENMMRTVSFCDFLSFSSRTYWCWLRFNLDSFTRLLLKYLLNSEDKYNNMQV